MTSPARPAEGAPLLSAHRSTPAIAAFLGGAVALYVLGSTVGDSWVLLAACLLGAVPLAAALLTPKPHRMVVTLRLPTRPTAGQPMRAVVSVRACSHGSSEARLTVTHAALLPVEILVPALAPNGVAAVEVQVVAPSRGAWIDAPIAAHIDMWSPWRLWSRRLTLLLSPLSLFVRPPAAAN